MIFLQHTIKSRKQLLVQRIGRTIALTLFALLAWGLTPAATAQTPCGPTVTVVRGDTLSRIAVRCNTTVSAIRQANPNLTNPDRIRVGQQLRMPSAGPNEQPDDGANGSITYIVQRGDWLHRIARRFDTTVRDILQVNPSITNSNLIRPGQRLVIPVTDEEPGEPSTHITPTSGPPGTAVEIRAEGFPANTEVIAGLGVVDTEPFVQTRESTDAQGMLVTELTIPATLEAERPIVAVVHVPAPGGARALSNEFTLTPAPPDNGNLITSTNIFLIALDDGGELGPLIGCNDSVVPVEVEIEPTIAPLTAALEILLSLDEQTYGEAELYNVFYQSDLTVEQVTIRAGEATVRLAGDLLISGVCDNPRVTAQLEETALQYETVDSVEILINDVPVEEVLRLNGASTTMSD